MTFAGMRVLSLESRRASEIAELVRRHGGEPISVPSMREVPLDENPAALQFAERLLAGEIDVAIFLTGVGTRILAEMLAERLGKERLSAALASIVTVVRGPKPRAVLADLGVPPTVAAPEPNTWRELEQSLERATPLDRRTVAIQEYGAPNVDLVKRLEGRGARVLRVPVYRWALPHDLGPLRRAIEAIGDGAVDVALFTSGTQVDHLFSVAGEVQRATLARGLRAAVVASIGPICNEALLRHGITADIVPDHPKMGHLVRAAAAGAASIVERKRQMDSRTAERDDEAS
jgi:uroporphyrinogen-III synthase